MNIPPDITDKLNARSRKALVGVHPDLVRVVELAAERCSVPVVVTEGRRDQERQAMLVAAGKSQTLNSRHLTGHAVDLVDADNFGYEVPDMEAIAQAMKDAAAELRVPIVWGGDWKWRDTPHFELCRTAYPANGVSVATRAIETAGRVVKHRGTIGAGAVAVYTAADAVVEHGLPAPPATAVKTVENAGKWLSTGKAVKGLGLDATAAPFALMMAAAIAAVWFLTRQRRSS